MSNGKQKTSGPGPKLDDAERERLAVLMEECAEVQQVIGKILRHGYNSHHPDGGPDNRSLLEIEIGHVLCAKRMMENAGDIQNANIYWGLAEKQNRVHRYLHFQSKS